jgi:hypothetical protein
MKTIGSERDNRRYLEPGVSLSFSCSGQNWRICAVSSMSAAPLLERRSVSDLHAASRCLLAAVPPVRAQFPDGDQAFFLGAQVRGWQRANQLLDIAVAAARRLGDADRRELVPVLREIADVLGSSHTGITIRRRLARQIAAVLRDLEPARLPEGLLAPKDNWAPPLLKLIGDGGDPATVDLIMHLFTLGSGYLERALVPADCLIAVPEGLNLADAGALLHDGRTALGLVEAVNPQAGEWVLVLGAAGGLGALLVQLAHQAGSRVIGAARGQHKLDLARRLGAAAVADYTEPGWAEEVLAITGPAGPQVVLDGVGGEIGRAAFEVTASGGRFSAHGA